jgi:hypothetical protein
MNRMAWRGWVIAIALVAMRLATGTAGAQEPPRPSAAAGLGQGEVLRLLDAYAVVQAQEMLGLDDAQYPRFVSRFKELLDVRRRGQLRRGQLLRELNQLTRDTGATDDAIRRKLAELDQHDDAARQDVAKSVAGVDDVLTMKQRARFRVFEEQMERRKLELMSRARQNARQPARRSPQ